MAIDGDTARRSDPIGGSGDDTPDGLDATAGDVDNHAGDDAAWRVAAGRADGRRRRRQGALVIGIALASALAGVLIGTQIKSPADEAADRRPPRASRITVPVEQRVLSSSIVLSGEVRYNEPTPITLGGPVGVEEGEAQVVTAVPQLDQAVQEGDVLLEVTGRPVFVLQGELPMYRRLATGSEGPDVLQLETALQRLGYEPGKVDTVFNRRTADAVAAFYTDRGYEAEGPSRAQREELRTARLDVTNAEVALRTAREALDNSGADVSESQLLQLRQALTAAEAALPIAEQAATRNQEAAAQEVRTATVSRDAARTIRDSARTVRDAAGAPGAIDPNTGEPFTVARIAELDVELAAAEEALARAEQTLTVAIGGEETARVQGESDVRAARDNLDLARVQFDEATAPVDTSAYQRAVEQAQESLDTATTTLQQLEATIGVKVSPGEVLFVPIAPTSVTELYVSPGAAATDQIGTLSTAETLVASRVSRGDSALVSVGAAVTIELRDVDLETDGTIVSVGAPRENPNDPNSGGDSGGGRLEVLIAPSDPTLLADYVFAGARITLDVESSDGEVLAVPVAALTVGPDGSSRVEVEISPITEDSVGETELVEVEVGMTASGLVEVISDELEPGDQVVVGTETGERRDLESTGDEAGDA